MSGTFEGVGSLQFTPDNKYALAFSGVVPSGGGSVTADTLMLQFKTEGEYLVASFSWGNTQTSGTADNIIRIDFNDQAIYGARFETGNESNHVNPKILPLIIPPFTNVKCYADTSADPHDWTWTMAAKVKGAIQQQNLEAITDANDWASE